MSTYIYIRETVVVQQGRTECVCGQLRRCWFIQKLRVRDSSPQNRKRKVFKGEPDNYLNRTRTFKRSFFCSNLTYRRAQTLWAAVGKLTLTISIAQTWRRELTGSKVAPKFDFFQRKSRNQKGDQHTSSRCFKLIYRCQWKSSGIKCIDFLRS